MPPPISRLRRPVALLARLGSRRRMAPWVRICSVRPESPGLLEYSGLTEVEGEEVLGRRGQEAPRDLL